MKKLLFTLSIALGLTFQANAQASNIGVNLSTALPIGDFADATDFGIGGGLSYDYYFSDHFNLGLEAEFLNFSYSDFDESAQIIPLMVTGAYHSDFGNEIDLYGGLGIGAAILTTTFEGSDTETNLAISPRIGLAYELGRRLYLDVNLRYGLLFNAQDEETTTVGGQTVITQPAVNNTSYLGLNVGILYTIVE